MIKINNGFVTNSSSTSYIISSKTKKMFTKNEFIKLMGVKEESILFETFEKLFYIIKQDAKPIENYLEDDIKIEDFLARCSFSEKEIQEISNRYKNGESVYYGKLNDSGSPEEIYFCYQSFILVNDDFYFNAEVDAY